MANYYQPSGKFSSTAFVYFILLSITLFPLLGALYAYAIWYIPLIYVNFIVTGIFAFIIGFLISFIVIKKGKVRNIPLGYVFGFLGALITMYFHWAFWADLAINAGEVYGNSRVGVAVSNVQLEQVFYLITHPEVLFSVIKEINEYGTWGIRGNTVSGIFLAIIWAIEFLGVTIITIIISVPAVKSPFCEKDGEWFAEEELKLSYIYTKDDFKKGLENKEITVLENVVAAEDAKNNSHSVFTLYSSHQREYYISVENKLAKADKDGKASFDNDEFIKYLQIDKAIYDTIKQGNVTV